MQLWCIREHTFLSKALIILAERHAKGPVFNPRRLVSQGTSNGGRSLCDLNMAHVLKESSNYDSLEIYVTYVKYFFSKLLKTVN